MKIIIQARTNSTRLPNKILLPFAEDKTILDIVISTCLQVLPAKKIILATSIAENDNVLEDFSSRYGILFFRGDEQNVAGRFINAAECTGTTKLIRVCSDNPFLLPQSLEKLMTAAATANEDYISFTNANGIPAIKTHLGLYTEFTTLAALKKVLNTTNEVVYKEHVTNFIYSNPQLFNIRFLNMDDCLISRNDLRFTCDTIDDFLMLQQLYSNYITLYGTSLIEAKKLVALTDQHSSFKEVMEKGIKEISK